MPPPGVFARFVLGEDAKRKPFVLNRPFGTALEDGKLYVCDGRQAQVAIFDFAQKRFSMLGGAGMHKYRAPASICISPEGERYVCDARRGDILVFDREGRLFRKLSVPDGMRPSDAAVHGGELYVADLKSNLVLVLDPADGRVLRKLGATADGRSRLGWPTALAVGPRGHLYVADTLNARVRELDREGRIVKVIGTLGTGIGQLVRPKGVALDKEGRLYVADAASQVVQIFDPSGPSMAGDRRLTFDAEAHTIAREGGSWLSEGFKPGARIQVVGSSKNDGSYRIAPADGAVSDKTLQLTDVEKVTSEGPTKVTAVHGEARLLLFFGGPGPKPGDMTLPSRVTISYEGIEHFAGYASPDFKIEYLIFVSNQFDAVKKVGVYGFGTYMGVVPAEQDKGRGVAPASKTVREPGDSNKDGPGLGADKAAASERRGSP